LIFPRRQTCLKGMYIDLWESPSCLDLAKTDIELTRFNKVFKTLQHQQNVFTTKILPGLN